MSETFEEKCIRLEHWETDPWAAEAILKKEILTSLVVDPCAGTGILAEAAKAEGYQVYTNDINCWDYTIDQCQDFLLADDIYFKSQVSGHTVFMNPPFKLSEKFIERCFELGARKIVCFQRFSWFEGSDVKGKKRGTFWKNNMPSRIYVCGDRAHCHLHSYPEDKRKKGSTKHTFAWFVWEEGQPAAALTSHIFKSEVAA